MGIGRSDGARHTTVDQLGALEQRWASKWVRATRPRRRPCLAGRVGSRTQPVAGVALTTLDMGASMRAWTPHAEQAASRRGIRGGAQGWSSSDVGRRLASSLTANSAPRERPTERIHWIHSPLHHVQMASCAPHWPCLIMPPDGTMRGCGGKVMHRAQLAEFAEAALPQSLLAYCSQTLRRRHKC